MFNHFFHGQFMSNVDPQFSLLHNIFIKIQDKIFGKCTYGGRKIENSLYRYLFFLI